jgi:hypothetical protein
MAPITRSVCPPVIESKGGRWHGGRGASRPSFPYRIILTSTQRRVLDAIEADLEHEPSKETLTLSIRPTPRPRVPATEGSLLQAAEEHPTPLAASVEVDAASISLPDITPGEVEDLVNYNVCRLPSRRRVRS